MPVQTPKHYHNGKLISKPIVLTGTAVSNGSGIARMYLTDDGTNTGRNIFKDVYSWSTDVVSGVPVDSRATAIGANYVEITCTRFGFNGITVLGIPVLGSVTVLPASGVTVMFTILGD